MQLVMLSDITRQINLTMYAFVIVPPMSLVTSIKPSQSQSSSWKTISLQRDSYYHSLSVQTNIVLAQADGESLAPDKLPDIDFLAFHLLERSDCCSLQPNGISYLWFLRKGAQCTNPSHLFHQVHLPKCSVNLKYSEIAHMHCTQ